MSETNTSSINNNTEKLSEFICNGLGCANNATEEINVKVGKFGSIAVSVCSKCKDVIKRKEEMFSEKLSLADPFSLEPIEDTHQHNIQSTGD